MSRLVLGLALILPACDGGLDGTGTTLEQCDTAPIDDVDVSDVAISGDELTLTAGYSGGCEEHEFRLCWDGSVMESDPPQVDVHLIHDGNGDNCLAHGSRPLAFDLSGAGLPSGEVIIGIDGESVSYIAP